jgi:hypothetical protein
LWEPTRARGLRPTFAGALSDDDELRREFLVGARSYGFELVDLDDHELIASMRAERPPRFPIQPQQLWLVDALNAAGYDEFVVEIMRRASKTTTIFLLLHGRCLCRPGYQVTFSAQSGVKGSARLREWKTRLDATDPDPEASIPPWRRGQATVSKRAARHLALFGDDELVRDEEPTTRRFRILMGETAKGIYYQNLSQFLVLKPDADAYRGEAGDTSWVDEAQEIDPEEGAALIAGIIPLQDTKPGASLIVSGTAGELRVGPFWERVDKLRTGNPDIGGVDYCAPEDTPWEIVEDEEAAMTLLESIHPGIGTLTTLEKMRKNWRKMTKPEWAREYASLWPETYGTVVVPVEQWANAVASRRPPKPERVAFGMAIKPGGSVACIAAAWRNSKGEAYIEIVEHRLGTDWLPVRAQELTRDYRGSTIAYDDISEGKATAAEMERLSPKPRLRVQTYRENAAGCVMILRELERGRLKHFDDVALNVAVQRAAKREVRGDQGVWLWKPSEPGVDITPLDAATRALRNWDQYMANGGRRLGVIAPTTTRRVA